MSISQLARSISASSTLALDDKARILRERGEPVISLGIGEPKNKTPITAILSSSAKLSEGNVKYTPPDGTPSLKKAIIRYTEENYNRIVEPENIIVSTGAKQSIYNAIVSIINPQDEVILLAPYWVSYPEIVKLAYGIPVIVTPEDGSFKPRFKEIERAVTPYTKAIIVNSPNNPSGIVYSDELLSDIVEMCEKKNIYLIADDIYHKIVFDGKKATPAYSFTKRDIESTMVLVVNGVSKLYGMTGFRIGWITANKKHVEVMCNIQSQITSGTSVLLQAAAEGALTGMQSVVENLRLTFENNRNVIMQELRTFNDVKVIEPEGAFYCMPDFRAYTNNSVELANHILNKALVVTIPGIDFGMEGHLRLSFAGSIKDIISAVERIKWSLDPNSPNEIFIGDRKYIRDWL